MRVKTVKPLQDSSKSLFRLLFNADPAPQLNEVFAEPFAFVDKGGGKTVGPEGEFEEEVDAS